jgi:hypothetical protein
MDAVAYFENGEWWVLVVLNDAPVDVAGPFGDEYDAVMAARRAGE